MYTLKTIKSAVSGFRFGLLKSRQTNIIKAAWSLKVLFMSVVGIEEKTHDHI